MGTQELRLQGHQVAVAGRGVDDALDVHVVLDAEGDGHGAHADPGHRGVTDVHHVRAGVAEQPCSLQRAIDADAAWWVDLDGDHEAALREGACQAGVERAIRRLGAGDVCLRERGAGARPGDRAGAIEGVRAGLRAAPVRGGDGPEGLRHRRGVGGRGAAAAADHRRPRIEQLADDGPEVGRFRRVDEAALEALRKAGVGHDRAGRLARTGRAELAERVEAGEGADPAVDAHRVHAGVRERREGHGGGGAVGEHEGLAEGHRRDQRHVRRAPGLRHGEQEVMEVEEGLDDQEIDAALEEAIDLLAVDRPDGGVVRVAQLAGGRAERADAAADPRIPSADVAGLAGDLGGAAVQATRLGGEAEAIQAQPVGPERQGLDEVCARVQVLAVDRPDEIRSGRGQLVQAGALRDAAGEQERAHPAVGEERAFGEAGGEAGAGLAHEARILAERPAGPARPRRRPSVRAPSTSSRTWGAAGRPLYVEAIEAA